MSTNTTIISTLAEYINSTLEAAAEDTIVQAIVDDRFLADFSEITAGMWAAVVAQADGWRRFWSGEAEITCDDGIDTQRVRLHASIRIENGAITHVSVSDARYSDGDAPIESRFAELFPAYQIGEWDAQTGGDDIIGFVSPPAS